MPMLQLHLPDFVYLDTREMALILATKLYETGKLSLGQAADLAGVSKRTFIELLGDYGASLFNYAPGEIEQDFRNA